jgi:hypothetical protein
MRPVCAFALIVVRDASALSAPDIIQKMWRHLPEATVDTEGFLSLTQGSFPHAHAATKPKTCLLVTDWYSGLADYIMGLINSESPEQMTNVLITGRPGKHHRFSVLNATLALFQWLS